MDIRMDLTPILITSVVFLTSALIVATVFYFVHRAKELRHATIRLALEKGQPLPPELLGNASLNAPGTPGSDLSKGVKLIFIGVGLSLFFLFTSYAHWAIGLIVLFVGIGYLVAHLVTRQGERATPPLG